jgi:arginyl-tRNA synthetase
MKAILEQAISRGVHKLYDIDVVADVTGVEPQFGDYTTNVAFQLAARLKLAPQAIAEALATAVVDDAIQSVEPAGAGYLNLRLKDEWLWRQLQRTVEPGLKGQSIVIEYSDPNPFKILHAGHIYTTVVGDAIARLLEAAGAKVHRVNYGGDVGRHVATTMWAIIKKFGGEHPAKLDDIPEADRAAWLANCYVEGTRAYEEDENAKAEITAINKHIYDLYATNDHESPLAIIYWTCRRWSYEAFDAFYARFGTKMDKYYPESEVVEIGLQAVRQQIGKVFEESQGAVVFKGEKYGLHTRVFINSEGLPTYEAKEVGLIIKKSKDFAADRSIIITGNEQQEYMAVVMKAIEQFRPDLTNTTQYVPHGMLRLAEGGKMSSRKGNIVTALEVLEITSKAASEVAGKNDERVVLAAIKYAFLKQRIGGNIVYDAKESVNILGNSGPYLQYAHARARSILAKIAAKGEGNYAALEPEERLLLRKLSDYTAVVESAISGLAPHGICTYLYDVSQVFNRFYESNRVIGSPRQAIRLSLVETYADILRDGLGLLNIPAPDKV